MGYSIGTHARTKRLQQKMLSFMAKEYRPHWKIRGLPEQPCYAGEPTNDLSYIRSRDIVGIDYGAVAGFEREYGFVLVKWMALKISKLRWVFRGEESVTTSFRDPVPYMDYDGCDKWPVLQQPMSSVPEKLRWCCVDRWGFKLNKQWDEFAWESGSFAKAQAAAFKKFNVEDFSTADRDLRVKIHQATIVNLWPKIKPILAPMRTEMKRLEKAWNDNL